MAAPQLPAPFSVVQTAFVKGIAMADHVDIGVAQYRSPLDLEWLNWLVELLGGDATNNAHRGNFMVMPGHANGRGLFEFGSLVLLDQYAVEAGFTKNRGDRPREC